jgi:hypothetical protein
MQHLRNPTKITCGRNGDLFVCDQGNIHKISKGGVVTPLCGVGIGVSVVLDEQQQNLFVTGDHVIRVLSLTNNNTLSRIAGSGGRGRQDGIGALASFDTPSGIACHRKTGDLFVSDSYRDHIRRLSKVMVGERVEWLVSSIQIEIQLNDYHFSAVAVLNDTLFLTSYLTGFVAQYSLDRKEITVLAQLPASSSSGIAADTNSVYVSAFHHHAIAKIKLPELFWTKGNHQSMEVEKRHLIQSIVVASLCNRSFNSKCQLRRLPREIFFHILSFLSIRCIAVKE